MKLNNVTSRGERMEGSDMLWGKIVTAEWQEKRKNITSFVIRKEQ
jgi:hypothetical protein